MLPIQLKTISILGNNTGSIADFEGAVRALDMHAIKPVIDEAFPFNEASGAFRHLAGASHVGKIVIDIVA